MLSTTGKAIAAAAMAVGVTIAVPTTGTAGPVVPAASRDIPVDALAALVPAIIGSTAGPADIAPNAQQQLLAQAKQMLAGSPLPIEIKSILLGIISFLDGSVGPGPKLPENGPAIAQFLYPSIGKACINETSDSVGTALAVPGPAALPVPGPRAGQAGFVFTALGTAPPTPRQPNPLTVTWLNLDSRRTQSQPLTTRSRINPNGPATLSAIADTGPGRIIAVISGGLTTQSAPKAAPRSCSFIPTLGMFTVGGAPHYSGTLTPARRPNHPRPAHRQ